LSFGTPKHVHLLFRSYSPSPHLQHPPHHLPNPHLINRTEDPPSSEFPTGAESLISFLIQHRNVKRGDVRIWLCTRDGRKRSSSFLLEFTGLDFSEISELGGGPPLVKWRRKRETLAICFIQTFSTQPHFMFMFPAGAGRSRASVSSSN